MAKRGLSMKRKHSDFFPPNSPSLKEPLSWIEQFTPDTVNDLAVHKKKVSDVQLWLQNFFSPARQQKLSPILLLTGPPGVGKTATIQAVCNALKAELYNWSNTHTENTWKSNDDELLNFRDTNKYSENQTVAFSRFLLHAVKYSLFAHEKKVILVEEFPNALIRNPELFHEIMRKFYLNGKYPAIFIISDNAKGESEENRLFPKDLQLKLGITNISFNPVAPTMLMKVLTRINSSSKLESSSTKLNKSQLESISSDSKGDIRNAINTMQFMCMSQNKHATAKDASEKPTSKRDSSLFLFHALGKILYCKRDPALKSEIDLLPAKLKHLERDPLLANAEEVYEHTCISPEGFHLFLHENFLPFASDIGVATSGSAWLSLADAISVDWNGRDTLNEYAVSLATRGLMFNIVSCTSGKRWRPLHKPEFFENNSKKKRLTNSLKWNFKGTSSSVRELQIDLLPFICKIQPKNYNPGQISLSKELGEMNVKRVSRTISRTLDEKECFEQDLINSEIDFDDWTWDDDEEDNEERTNLSDEEEIVIEEYDF